MAYLFLGKPDNFWTGLSSLVSVVNTVIVFIGGLLARIAYILTRDYNQKRDNSEQILFDSFIDERNKIFKTFPIELVLTSQQFSKHVPSASKLNKLTKDEE